LCGSGDWTLSEDSIQIILFLVGFICGLLACSSLYYLASYKNIMVLTELLNLKLKCFPRKWRTQIFVHQTLISRAVSEGEDHFNRFYTTYEEDDIFEEFVNEPWNQDKLAEIIYSKIKTFESNTDNIRSKFLSLNPAEIVIDEVMKPDCEGNFQVNRASRVLDLQLVI
jgi:hypothetical protein